ncbi:MAG: hypothetical protein WC781_00975 [Candidatus Pacearchaeota archaeon]|jgi:ribosomal protein S24E
MEILQTKKNNLLHREEIVASLESEITPSKTQVTQMISDQLKKPVENIVIEKIESNFGTKNVRVNAKVYNDVQSKEKFETVTRKAKKKIAEEKKKAAEAAKAVPAEGDK